MTEAKVLVLDIETSPMLVHVWNLKDQYVGLNQLVQDWHIMAWGAKELGAPASSIEYHDMRNLKHGDDSPILRRLWKLLDWADIVITQNGKSFDAKKINARFMLHGMPPPSPYKHLDTYLIAKNVAGFTSNSLEYMSERFCVKYKKLSHPRFPGLSLWTECLKGNKQAWQEMKKYNIHDVLATEELYMKIRAWSPATAPKVFTDGRVCEVCGGNRLQRRGYEQVKKFRYVRLQCQNPTCGKWQRGAKV
jgi:DNA polymerase elongation subunit (family B)